MEIEIPYPLFQYLTSESSECDIQKICRICLSVNDPVLYPLFSEQEQCVLANMFMAIADIQMNPEDGYPSNICAGCRTEVMNYYEFKMKCVKSDYSLKSVFNAEFVINETSTTIEDSIDTITESKSSEHKLINDEINVPAAPVIQDTGTDYLQDFKESMSCEEALCIVQDTINNEKEITIIDSDLKTFHEKTKRITKGNGTHTKKGKHQCTICLKKFHEVKSLKEHTSKHHAPVAAKAPYPCDHCKDAFDSESDLKIHNILHNQGAAWRCTQCQKEFKGRAALRRHIERHMTRRRFACSRCGAAFVERYALQRHTRVHTGQVAEKKHKCTHCDKRFTWLGALKAHMSAHGGERGCVCSVCGAAFPSQRLLASHQRVHSSDKPYECSYCEKRFRHESTRNTHLRTHTGERPYVCAQCGKAFIQHSNMTLHMRTHTGERPYPCTMCARTFSSSSTLKAHTRTHTGERPYACNVCGKRFARVSLKNHMLLHSDERPHACPAPSCHKSFVTSHRLRDHYRLHTGVWCLPYECAHCPEKFTTKSQLMKHVKKHEKKKKATKKGVMLMPVTVSDKSIQPVTNPQSEDSKQFMVVDMNEAASDANQEDICTVQETPIQLPDKLIFDKNTDVKTEVIVMDHNPNLVGNSVSYVNDVNYANDVNLVTVNEGEVSISAASAAVDGTTVKLYQYDQSLLQIHTGGAQLTISRISSKMTANF